MRDFPRIKQALTQQPWAISMDMLRTMQDILAEAEKNPSGWSPDTWRARIEAVHTAYPNENPDPEKRAKIRMVGPNEDIPVVPIFGPLTLRASWFDNMSGMTSYEKTSRMLQEAIDTGAETILLEIDSPGGAVAGLEETAQDIYSLGQNGIQTIAFVNTKALSAAYYLASQADSIIATPSGEVGSIGIVLAGWDDTRARMNAGIDPVVVASTPAKAAGRTITSIDEWKRSAQDTCDKYFVQFKDAVRRGRGASLKLDLDAIDPARIWLAAEARDAGLIDDIGTLPDILESLTEL